MGARFAELSHEKDEDAHGPALAEMIASHGEFFTTMQDGGAALQFLNSNPALDGLQDELLKEQLSPAQRQLLRQFLLAVESGPASTTPP